MRFLSKKSLIEFTLLMEGLGYKPSISINEIKQYLKKCPFYVSQLSCEIDRFNNLFCLNFYDKRKVIQWVIMYVKKA